MMMRYVSSNLDNVNDVLVSSDMYTGFVQCVYKFIWYKWCANFAWCMYLLFIIVNDLWFHSYFWNFTLNLCLIFCVLLICLVITNNRYTYQTKPTHLYVYWLYPMCVPNSSNGTGELVLHDIYIVCLLKMGNEV